MEQAPFHALIRFGFGRRGAEPLPGNPRAWLLGQLQGPDPVSFAGAPDIATALAARESDRVNKPPPGYAVSRDFFRDDCNRLLEAALTGPAPFRERLAWFWTNHFTVSIRQGGTASVVGCFVRDAIRPHVTGRFEDMVLAVMRHPAMLMYLDNTQSVGPNSRAGQNGKRGLNENLARECMELHTVSPASGYTQADVTALARIITGWSVAERQMPFNFLFRPFAHEPGAQTLMGQSFPEGEQGGVEALRFLANHPSTHRFLATKLVRHFVADAPAAADVKRIEGVLRDTGGNLGAASAALVELPSAWQPFGKLRSPFDYVLATLRALDLPPESRPNVIGSMVGLGQPMFNATFPIGWPDTAAGWAGPEAVLRRVDFAFGLAGRASQMDARALAEQSLGPLAAAETLDALRLAGSRREAVAMLLAAPEFQRR